MDINKIAAGFEAGKDNYPYPSPFVLSSVERDWCRGDLEREIYIKRVHLSDNLATIQKEIGMDESEKEQFLKWWCSPRPGTSEIRAEGDAYFNLRQRAENWMERVRKRQAPQEPRQSVSRIDKLRQNLQKIHEHFNGNRKEHTDLRPDEQ